MSENKHKKAQEEKHSNVKYAVVGVLSVVLVAFLLVWNTGIIQRNAAAVTVDGDFVFVRQYRHGTRQILLELPAGCMEPTDANPAAGAARELFEETGYAGSEPVFLCKVAPNAACISNFAHCYLIRDCKKVSSQHLDATEDLEIVVMSAEETKKLMAEGGLVQAVHVAAMYYAEKLLNK